MRNDSIFNLIVAIVAMDIISDIMFINAVLSADEGKQTEDNEPSYFDKHPLVGMRYIVKNEDNAYDRASGVSVTGLKGKEYIIVGDPFVENEHLMITIFSTDSEREYNVIFEENAIVEE